MSEKMLIRTDQVNPLEVFVQGKYSELLEFIKNESRIDNPDATTAKGRALIKSMAAKIASSKVFVVGVGKSLADTEKKKIADKLEAINTSKKFIDDSLVYLKAHVREPLTMWEEEKKKEEEAKKEAEKIIEKHGEALELNKLFDEKKRIAAESERIEKEKLQLAANQEAIKNFGSASQVAVNEATKAQGVAEAEAERLRLKAIEDEKQAEMDKEKAVEAERIRVQKEAEEKEAKRLKAERIEREKKEARAADVQHRKKINNEALVGFVSSLEILDFANCSLEDVGKEIIVAVIKGKIPNVFIKY